MDPSAFRSIMASFPTGVAVVTVTDMEGIPRGLTCSAVCSVSLTPAMLLICVGKTSNTLPALAERGSFVVNFLTEEAKTVAMTCASKAADKFSGIPWQASQVAHNAPILHEHVTAYAECLIHELIDAGDHIVIIANVVGGTVYQTRDPMVHAGGHIKQLAKAEANAA